MSCRTQRILGRRRGAKWYHAAPPPTGNGPGPEPLDGPIGRFLLPIGGGGSAEGTLTLHFHIKKLLPGSRQGKDSSWYFPWYTQTSNILKGKSGLTIILNFMIRPGKSNYDGDMQGCDVHAIFDGSNFMENTGCSPCSGIWWILSKWNPWCSLHKLNVMIRCSNSKADGFYYYNDST